ncbi:hypothetical protein M9Y10_039584 [Tritrichomonas musculus]|uniref:Uncharacterized protein n=1 Tax=Tritrichomonas musculus TaxID=1915356 RepID=A0ABR2KBL0_9EUKA
MISFEKPPSYLISMLKNFRKRPDMIRLVNRCCRPCIQNTSIQYANVYSTMFLNEIPYAVDSRFQFVQPSFLIFNKNDSRLKSWKKKIEDYIEILDTCKEFIKNSARLTDFMTNAIKQIGNVGEYVVFIQNITHNGMNSAFIENGLNFQKVPPIEGILKNRIESDHSVNPTNENNNSVHTINDSTLDNDTPLEKENQDNIDNIDSNVM